MKTWYSIREGSGLTHRGQKVQADKLIYLSVAQATLINARFEKVAAVDAPSDPKQVAVLSDWHASQKALKAKLPAEEKKPTSPPKENKAKGKSQ